MGEIFSLFNDQLSIKIIIFATMKDTNDHNNTTACDASRFALVELHLHVDGSLSADDVMWMAKEEVIIKTASQVCHAKRRGVGLANDSGSRR